MPTNKELEKNLIEMAQAIKELAQDVAELKAKPVEKESVTAEPFKMTVPLGTNNYPVPQEYRDVIDNVFNKNFGIDITYTVAGFMFTIIVPEKYSSLTPKEMEITKQDRRTKVIPNFEGVSGVRAWADLVYSSFPIEKKALITQDK